MSPASPLVEVSLFGMPEIRVAGRPLRKLRSKTAAWLFALLILRHGRVVPRTWLAAQLWTDSPPEIALGNLRRTRVGWTGNPLAVVKAENAPISVMTTLSSSNVQGRVPEQHAGAPATFALEY